MRGSVLVSVLAGAVVLLPGTRAQQALLQLQGQPYFGGSMMLHVTAPSDIGDMVWLAVGLDPLPLEAPVPTGKGPWYIGNPLTTFVIGTVQGNGRLDTPFTMPPATPGAEGVVIVLQGYVAPALTNPATLPLDSPYLLPDDAVVLASPNPQENGWFGSHSNAGDLNGDGHVDLVIAAHHEDHGGVDMSGRVYIHWGPGFEERTAITPPQPVIGGFFGIGLVVADLDGIPPLDLLVTQTSGDQPLPTQHAKLHFYYGSPAFPQNPSVTVMSPGSGAEFASYGAAVCTGDYDDDGHVDVAVGHSRATVSGIVEAGRVDIYHGPAFELPQQVASPSPAPKGAFGARVATADVNADGIDDLLESSPVTPAPPFDLVGSAHVFVNPGFDLFKTLPCPVPLGSSTRFGEGLLGGNLLGSSDAELIVSDAKNRVFVFEGPEFENYLVIAKPPGSQANPFGETAYADSLHLASMKAGGVIDLLIGDTYEGDEACAITAAGRVFIALGPYFQTFRVLLDKAPACGDRFGASIVSADLDGDGMTEILVGAQFAETGAVFNAGHATLLGH